MTTLTTKSPKDIIIVDDDELVRDGLSDWLSSIEGIKIAGEAGDAAGCISLIERVKPDLALVDVVLPGLSGIELIRQIKLSHPSVRCVILSGSMDPDLVFEGFSSGACGFLPKVVSAAELQVALTHIFQGNWYLSPGVAEAVLKKAIANREVLLEQPQRGDEFSLSDRERELLKMIAEGYTFAEIATQLDINPRSVERLKVKLEEKLGTHTLADLVRHAIKLGLVNP